jgi:Arc/MetJ family transcription regulator
MYMFQTLERQVIKLEDELTAQILRDWVNGWSQQDIAFAHNVSRKAVRTIVKHSSEQASHNLRMAMRKNLREGYAETYNAKFKYPMKFARVLAHANQREGLKAKYDPSYEEKLRKQWKNRGY